MVIKSSGLVHFYFCSPIKMRFFIFVPQEKCDFFFRIPQEKCNFAWSNNGVIEWNYYETIDIQ